MHVYAYSYKALDSILYIDILRGSLSTESTNNRLLWWRCDSIQTREEKESRRRCF